LLTARREREREALQGWETTVMYIHTYMHAKLPVSERERARESE
jgi:hypothetical protein